MQTPSNACHRGLVVPDGAIIVDAAGMRGSRSRRGFGEDARRRWVGGIE